ncbi:AMP-binding protein [Aureimonas sp. AU4]|uniref:AMP-binding protein n=1 Tax=Aureimonas sp. AU4 TaxID=1638163 RepID=UPI0007816C74|nr:AMP-binding protein [Aureimonas sp. AU4]
MSPGADAFRAMRDLLLDPQLSPSEKRRRFRWPAPVPFNWALDWFDGVLANDSATGDRPALRIREAARGGRETSLSFRELASRSSRIANLLARLGLTRGDRLLVMLRNEPALWAVQLACFKAGVTVLPASPLLAPHELRDRLTRGVARCVVARGALAGILDAARFEGLRLTPESEPPPGWRGLAEADAHDPSFRPCGQTAPDDPLLLYFTSGTTALPKLVLHTHRSYPVGSLSTMHWLGLRPGDTHLNVSSPGWAKHAWSSMFAPWSAGATVAVLEQDRFEPAPLLRALDEMAVTTFCAPPTVWRHLVGHGLGARPGCLREAVSSGEPLNASVIGAVARSWDLRVRDGYGQTETTAMVGHVPGAVGELGSMGRPLPGYPIVLLDAEGREAAEGEIALRLEAGRPAGLTPSAAVSGEGIYRTGDVARRNADGTLTFVGRVDDVFKSSDYRVSPFELESALVAHPAVREAAVVPMADALRLAVPQAFVLLEADRTADAATAELLFKHLKGRLSPYQRIRRIIFVEALPKTLSGKIRRRDLRAEGSDSELGRFEEPAANRA